VNKKANQETGWPFFMRVLCAQINIFHYSIVTEVFPPKRHDKKLYSLEIYRLGLKIPRTGANNFQ